MQEKSFCFAYKIRFKSINFLVPLFLQTGYWINRILVLTKMPYLGD